LRRLQRFLRFLGEFLRLHGRNLTQSRPGAKKRKSIAYQVFTLLGKCRILLNVIGNQKDGNDLPMKMKY